MVKPQDESPYICINSSRTNSSIHFNLLCISNFPISRCNTSIRNFANISPRHTIKCRHSRNKFSLYSKCLILWSIMVSSSRNFYSDCSCTRFLIDMTDSDHVAADRYCSNAGIAGCGRNCAIPSTCYSHGICQLIGIQNDRTLIQA